MDFPSTLPDDFGTVSIAIPSAGLVNNLDRLRGQSPPFPSRAQLKNDIEPCNPPKPTVIGIYGISGSGKSFILDKLRERLGEVEFSFYEGSAMISSLVPGGLETFHHLSEAEKVYWRVRAINAIKRETAASGKVAVVTGHLTFWFKDDPRPRPVYTPDDIETLTHIVYLNTPPEIIAKRVFVDLQKAQLPLPVVKLASWQKSEISTLRQLCHQNNILFIAISATSATDDVTARVQALIKHSQQPSTPEANISRVRDRVEEILASPSSEEIETFLVFDGDKTVAAEDTTAVFWQKLGDVPAGLASATNDPLKDLFSSSMGYSDAAFNQATLLYEEVCDEENFDKICLQIANEIPPWFEFIRLWGLAKKNRVGVVIVTCGLGRVWSNIIAKHGFSDTVHVIGGGRILDGLIVTPDIKASIVSQLKEAGHYVWAFGDSPLDISMLKEADQAIVVVGNKETRSSSMDSALSKAIREDDLQARQLIRSPESSPPRLDQDNLPILTLDDNILNSIFDRRPLNVLHATDTAAARILMSPMRDAAVAGPWLREAHANVGRYLATQYVSQLIGLEHYTISHVLGHQTTGHRLRNEDQTTIVALMRGGEPMALGINEVFPKAMFVHASSAHDIKSHHIQKNSPVILVDSVVNSGRSIIEFIPRIGQLKEGIHIVVVAGVVQAEAISERQRLAKVMRRYGASLVVLRLSDNKFTGTRATDTENRLFNTTHLA
ncbi:hypothetical protein F53441_3442 [Fusarium austroafricanum]|uniref:Phosphoribosyltransferase domain-containing protein n=1 Tax=Fusarium austroafricanum TaxID=2364996 RepID=A0A8H4PAN5_9HYPO|nr:hypothetical protein F53441_3442 [Fusarium austroafricanum]